jgi:hypothetical protein
MLEGVSALAGTLPPWRWRAGYTKDELMAEFFMKPVGSIIGPGGTVRRKRSNTRNIRKGFDTFTATGSRARWTASALWSSL